MIIKSYCTYRHWIKLFDYLKKRVILIYYMYFFFLLLQFTYRIWKWWSIQSVLSIAKKGLCITLRLSTHACCPMLSLCANTFHHSFIHYCFHIMATFPWWGIWNLLFVVTGKCTLFILFLAHKPIDFFLWQV